MWRILFELLWDQIVFIFSQQFHVKCCVFIIWLKNITHNWSMSENNVSTGSHVKFDFTRTSPSIINIEKRRIHLNLWGYSPFLLEFHKLKSKWKILSPVKFEIEDFFKKGAFIRIQMSSKCWVKHHNKTHSARDSWALPTYHIPGRLSI